MPTLSHDEIRRLSPAERLELIGELWDSIDPADVPLPPAQRDELLRRLQTFDQDRSSGVTWDQLKAQLSSRAP